MHSPIVGYFQNDRHENMPKSKEIGIFFYLNSQLIQINRNYL